MAKRAAPDDDVAAADVWIAAAPRLVGSAAMAIGSRPDAEGSEMVSPRLWTPPASPNVAPGRRPAADVPAVRWDRTGGAIVTSAPAADTTLS